MANRSETINMQTDEKPDCEKSNRDLLLIISWKRYTLTSIFLVLLFAVTSSFAVAQKRVLHISSYHPAFPTFFQQIEGIKSVFREDGILLDIEYMDTKRFPNRKQWNLFHNSLNYKLENTAPYDAIIVADDNALRYAIEEQYQLFKNIPIVFMGVNDIESALSQNDNPQITGVVEAVSIAETVELMIKLRPNATRIVAIVDNTTSGQGDLKNFYRMAEQFRSHEFSEISLADQSWPDFLRSLGSLEENSALLLLSAYKDKNSKTYLFEESLKKIKSVLNLPIFHLWYHGIGDGLIGGKVISHFEQGRTAATITQEILSGTPVSTLKINQLSPNKYVFDYSELKRNHIDISLLPQDSIILHEPDSFYKKYKKVIWAIVSTITVLFIALLVSLANILKRIKVENKLKMSEERLNLAMKAVSDGVWDWNIETKTVFYSDGWAAILSEESVEPTYEFWSSRIHPEDINSVLLSLQEHLDGTSNKWGLEHRLKTKSGDWKWVLGRGAVVDRNTDNKPVRMIGTMTDISDRKRTEEALRLVAASGHLSSKDIFPFLVQQIAFFAGMRHALIARINQHDFSSASTLAVWNGDRFGENFSYTLEGTPCKNVVDDGVCFYPSKVRALFPQDQLLVEMDAESYWGVPLLNSTGDAIGLMAVLHDQPISEFPQTLKLLKTFAIRAATELERMDIEEEFRNLFENTPVSSWLEDLSGIKKYFDTLRKAGVSSIETYFREHPEGIERCVHDVKVIDVNQATLDLHQAKSKEQLLHGLEKTFTPESLVVFKKEMIDIWNGKTQATYDAVVRTFNDEIRYVTVSYKIVPGHEESLDKVLVTLVDITEKTLADKQKNKLEMQLQQAQKMEAIGTLAGGIAHDFNNILAAIIGYAEMAREDSPPESIAVRDLDKVLEGGKRAKDLVHQILAFSHQNQMEKIPLQPANIVKEALKILRPSLPTTIEINQDITSATGLILADPTQIHQILMNLCTNAFHAMEENGGTLDISLKETDLSSEDLIHEPDVEAGTFVQLSVCDSGPGIPPDIKANIFEPYFSTKETGKGTGMGLAIVHGIVKSYGGFITFYSEPGEGTAFHVFLPVIEKELLPEADEIEEIPTGRDRILFIDDEEILVEMGKEMLERLGYHVTVKNNSIKALETFQNQPDQFDLVITDQTMPGMTGADIARRMIQIRPDIPIILCTGYSTVISAEKAKSMGIREFALKPLSKKDIAVLIRKVLDNP